MEKIVNLIKQYNWLIVTMLYTFMSMGIQFVADFDAIIINYFLCAKHEDAI